jgi:hypothetical protein
MKSIISASASLLLAGLGLAPLAAAQTMDQLSPQSEITQKATRPYSAPWWSQTKLPQDQIPDPPADPPGMESDFDPYPPGYGLYSGGND